MILGTIMKVALVGLLAIAGSVYWLQESPESFADAVPQSLHKPIVKAEQAAELIGLVNDSASQEILDALSNRTSLTINLGQIIITDVEYKPCVMNSQCREQYGTDALCDASTGDCYTEVSV
jgi:hypothetical protein